MITNNNYKIIYAIEAKSTVGKQAYIPNDQICRCLDILDMFSIYKHRCAVFAFKFAKSKLNEKLQYYFFRIKISENLRNILTLKCDNRGYLTIVRLVPDSEIHLMFNRHESLRDLKTIYQDEYPDAEYF